MAGGYFQIFRIGGHLKLINKLAVLNITYYTLNRKETNKQQK